MESFSDTQCILEELAFAAEGGFLDEPNHPENVIVSSVLPAAITKLTDGWSNLVNNPLMSDVTVRTKSTDISAHRLVFTVRFPSMLNDIKNSSGVFFLDWASYSASAALRVLRFIYAASYEHEEDDAHYVYRIARRYGITELIDLLPNQYESDAGTSEEDEDASLLGKDLEIDYSHNSSKKTSLPSGDLSRLSVFQKTVRFSKSSQEELEEKENINKEELTTPSSSQLKSSEANEYEEQSIMDIEKEANVFIRRTPSKDVSSEIHQMGRTVTSAMDMEISSNTTSKIVPLSPDMFHETICHSDEEPEFAEDVVDLTQETNSDQQSKKSLSPAAGSCEMNENSLEKSDVSMPECSAFSSPPNLPLLQSPQNSTLPQNLLNDSVVSYSRSDPSSFHNSMSYWSCSVGEIGNDVLSNCQSPVAEVSPLLEMKKSESETIKPCDQYVDDEFPDELDSIFGKVHDVEPSPQRTTISLAVPCSSDGVAADINTPEGPRQAKKRKMDVTPLPDYQSMETPLLKV
jgi:hypothetical protein